MRITVDVPEHLLKLVDADAEKFEYGNRTSTVRRALEFFLPRRIRKVKHSPRKVKTEEGK